MPPDQLTASPWTAEHPHTEPDGIEDTVRAVLAHLTGTPLDQAAARFGADPDDLAQAAHTYDLAGRGALIQRTGNDWWHINIQFAHWPAAEDLAVEHLAPLLAQGEDEGALAAWWFIRKTPCWRLRLAPRQHQFREQVSTVLDAMTSRGQLTRWWTGLYEPETPAFGGEVGMDIAHRLFHADSRAVLSWPSGPPLGRPELSVLLCSTMFDAAGLEWYERGDVWHRVTLERPLPGDHPRPQSQRMADDVRQLLQADTTLVGPLFGPHGPLAFAAYWAAAFQQAGSRVGEAARAGTLDRGLRSVLGYHVLFHWNRCGIPYAMQSRLARAAREAILGENTAPS